MSSKKEPRLIEVANFDQDHPNYIAEVVVFPNGKARIIGRTGWTHDKDLDHLACETGKQLARKQREEVRANRVRLKIRRKKNPETGKEEMDRDTRRATIVVWPKSDKYTGQPVSIMFDIGAAAGDFKVSEVIQETRQWIEVGTVVGETVVYRAHKIIGGETVSGDHEWWAARAMAIRAIETAIKTQACKDKKAQAATQRAAAKEAEKIRRQGGKQLTLI